MFLFQTKRPTSSSSSFLFLHFFSLIVSDSVIEGTIQIPLQIDFSINPRPVLSPPKFLISSPPPPSICSQFCMLEKLCALIDCHGVTFRHLKAFLLGVSISCKSWIRTLFIRPSHHLYSPRLAAAAAAASFPLHSIQFGFESIMPQFTKCRLIFGSADLPHETIFATQWKPNGKCSSARKSSSILIHLTTVEWSIGRPVRSPVGGYIRFFVLLLVGVVVVVVKQGMELYISPSSHTFLT